VRAIIETLIYENGILKLLDQTKLPFIKKYVPCTNYKEVGSAIVNMIVRGAPLIGVTAAYGLYLAATSIKTSDFFEFKDEFKGYCDYFKSTRPTAINLNWAVNRIYKLVISKEGMSNLEIAQLILNEANLMKIEDIETNKKIGFYGNKLIKNNSTILTHCNAGALATCGYGTALGVIRTAFESGKNISVYADETRPYLQGARLTAFELAEANIPTTLICDNMAGYFINKGVIDCIVVGADRIAKNGDTANKIGTYTLSVLAKENSIPFYIAAPISTIDISIKDGTMIPIEERDSREITHINDLRIAPENINIKNPSFDVTPNSNISAIITEEGIITAPYIDNISTLF